MIELKNIRKNYEGFALKDISFKIEDGEFVSILGESGSGKSTLLNLIAGVDEVYSGEIRIDGETPKKIIKDGDISMVFQDDLLLPHLNVWENIAFGLKIKKIGKDEIDKRVKEVLKEMDLIGKEKRYSNELSGGERQRVSIARAIVTKPKLLLMDEPFSALDYNLRNRMQDIVKTLHKKMQITIVFVTHDREEAFFLSDKIGVMHRGILLDYGTSEELYYYPKTFYTAKLLGTENIFKKEEFENIFKCETAEAEFIGIRAKDIKIVDNSPLCGIIKSISFGMGEYLLSLEINGKRVEVIEEGFFQKKVGDKVYIEQNKENQIVIKGERNA